MSWQPTASIETLRRRAQWLKKTRDFFASRSVLEVETPVLSPASVPDPHIESLQTQVNQQTYYLQTSPELYMKRLLAAGSGPIYQISRVFRDGELGRLHNPEFTLIEWYQPGYSQQQLMQEVAELVSHLAGSIEPDLIETGSIETIKYGDLFKRATGINPLQTDWQRLNEYCESMQLDNPITNQDWSAAMDWLLSTVIQPTMQGLVFVIDYPASQASLARLDPDDSTVARRFELFIDGIEMANGFEELTDAAEQRRRFEQENQKRQAASLANIPMDENFIAALESGMPETSGVALGLDRLLMWATKNQDIHQVMSFRS